jgi:DGQHR domain-containing protein
LEIDMMASAILQFPVNVLTQKGHTIYSFVMSAEELASYAKVDRFGDSSDGVNRKLDQNHALDIANAMIENDALMLDAICGDLQGDWQLRNGYLVRGEDAFLSIDDGQHRWWAVSDLLNPEERARWSFTINATMGIDYETRLRIFRQQSKRKRIDSKLDLAQRHKLNDWKNDAEREAYKLLLELNSDPDSPLKGMILLEETVKRPYEHQHRPEGINANGLWMSLKSAMGKGSPLYTLSIEKRVEVVRNMIRLASEVWPTAWCSKNHVLTTARGINAVLMLMVSSPEFRGVIGSDFTVESLRHGLEYAKRFKWHKDVHKNSGVKEITEGLNRAIGTARARNFDAVVA